MPVKVLTMMLGTRGDVQAFVALALGFVSWPPKLKLKINTPVTT